MKKSLFTKREIRAILTLLPILAVGVWISIEALKPRFDETMQMLADAVEAPTVNEVLVSKTTPTPTEVVKLKVVLRKFDPNTATYEDMRAMGLDKFIARNVVKYRERGGRFEIPEDFALSYGLSDSLFKVLKPYIIIGDEFKVKPFKKYNTTTTTKDSTNKAALFADYKKTDTKSNEKVDLNSADSAELVALRGIGPKSAHAIIEYRKKLGGFYSIYQLGDIEIINEKNFEMFCEEIYADSCIIKKIGVNFASPKELGDHPYLTPARVRKILKNRQLKGGWRTIEDMINDNTLSKHEAEKLDAYLHFTPK